MEPILKAYFNNFKKSFDIETSSSNGEIDQAKEAKAFERFVNYTLFSLDFPDIFTADEELLDSVCVGGGHDTGIDGIGIKVNDRLIRDIDEIKEIAQTSRQLNVEFIFIQAKMRPNFDASELNTFGTGVKVFFSEGCLPENSRIAELRAIKDFVYNDEKIIAKLDDNPSLYLYYVGTGAEPTDQHILGMKQWLKKEFADNFFFKDVDISIVGGKQLTKFSRELENKFEVQINVIDIFPLIVDPATAVKKAYAFTCNASEFLKIITKEDGYLRRSLFYANVRDYLGDTAVNSEMEATIAEHPEMFLLCNNGITIVCSDFDQVRDKLVKIENPQIVNGCQTSNSIFNSRSNPNTSKCQILVRLITTENHDITNKIVRGTNKQNQVLDEAFEATFPFHQDILEPFFLAISDNQKLYYERRSKQYSSNPLINKTQIVNLRILTQSFVGMFLDAPHDSHRHEAKLIEEYCGDSETRRLYREDHSPWPYYTCAMTWYMFEKYFRHQQIDRKYKTYKAHLYLAFKFSVGEVAPRLTSSKSIESYCRKIIETLKEDKFITQVKKALQVFDETEAIWTKNKSRYGIKDNKEFTELLLSQLRDKFITKQLPIAEPQSPPLYEGHILRLVWKHSVWFGFISRGLKYNNVYFDSRSYKGDARELIPNVKVQFELAHGERGDFARNVTIRN